MRILEQALGAAEDPWWIRAVHGGQVLHLGPFGIDTGPPTTSDDATDTYVHSATVSLTATDHGGIGVDYTLWNLDGSGWVTGTVVTTSTLGLHSLDYYSVGRFPPELVERVRFLPDFSEGRPETERLREEARAFDLAWRREHVNDRLRGGKPSLHLAARRGNLDCMKGLLELGADLKAQDSDGASVLFEAAAGGHLEVVSFLLANGLDASRRTEHGIGPIHRAAMTGHLLFSTLHTNYAINAITTFRHLGIQSFLIAGSVICVVAQRLVRSVCPLCRDEEEPTQEQTELLRLSEVEHENPVYTKGMGCQSCKDTGYSGRQAVFEYLRVTKAIRQLITENASQDKILETALGEGMKTLREDTLEKVIRGKTSLDELMRVVS